MKPRETVDGVVYVDCECVSCGTRMSVSEAALELMRGRPWPKCNECVWHDARVAEHRKKKGAA